MSQATPVVNYLKEYQVPKFEIEQVALTFDLHPTKTLVKNKMVMRGLAAVSQLVLSGEQLDLISVQVDGLSVTEKCTVNKETLTIPVPEGKFVLVIETIISPEQNTALEGLYRTSGNYCTQCEAEGFRKITYFLDRPDVLTLFTTKIIADKTDNSVLLSNGNLIESGELENNRHYAVWEDPFKKPCYLFALVAGNLEHIKDTFMTADQREVDLRIYVEAQNIDKCAHAMESLKKSMAWDEKRFGLIYDLDIYMIVAVDDFNMGAMENKGLNVFNSKFVLAKPDTATDVDYEGIEAVIGHEYFHNWTGNRVTCRDWFQLTLKEGLTVFRDQEFTADMLSPAVKRIEDVKRLRSNQFPEDAGPMSHPIQPQSYIEMNNFYTMTVYEKGAEVVRMYHTLLGEAGFRKGMDLYFERHDGQAVTVEDFRCAMADANAVDLSQMHQWYIQSGTPLLKITSCYNALDKTYELICCQSVNGETDRLPLLIPIEFGMLNSVGESIAVVPDVETLSHTLPCSDGVLLTLTKATQAFRFIEVDSEPTPSLLRGFSAPVLLDYEYSDTELSLLARADKDSFTRWEAFQSLALKEIKQNVLRFESRSVLKLSDALSHAFVEVLTDKKADPALIALTITLPDLTYIGEQYTVVNVDAIYAVHQWLREALVKAYESEVKQVYQALIEAESLLDGVYRYDKEDIARRKLKGACLRYLMLLPNQFELGKEQYLGSNNMTDTLTALESISHSDHPDRVGMLSHFYDKWHNDSLVLDKWFTLQAASHHIHALKHVKALVAHPDFTYSNPNRVRSVLGVFGRLNILGFHKESGEGYQFLMEQVLKVDAINPQVAARIVAPFTHWQRYDAARKIKMQTALNSMLNHPGLSKDLYEIVSKSLAVSEGSAD